MKDVKIPSHQVDVAEIMKKIRRTASNSQAEMTLEERVRREAKGEFLNLAQSAQVPDLLVDEIRQQKVFPPYDPRSLYSSARPGLGSLIGLIRKILRPITKLFINLDPMAYDVNRLTILNNFYLKTIQDLIVKTSALRVEMHSMKKRMGHHSPREGNYQRHNHNHRRFRDRHPRREGNEDPRNATQRSGPRPVSTEEPPAQ